MIADLGRRLPGKEQRDHDRGRQQGAYRQHAIDADIRSRGLQSRAAGEFGAMKQRDEQHRDDQPRQRHRPQRQRECAVGDMGKAADHDVLRVAGDRRGRPDIRGHRHRQQVRERPASHRQRQFEHQRGQHQTDRVVDQEGGKDAGGRDHRAEQDHRASRPLHDPGGGGGEEAREPQAGDDDHHAEQQRDRIEVDRLVGVFERQGARCDHQAGADQRDAGPVDVHAGHPADRERQIASDKDGHGRDAPDVPAPRIAGREQSGRQRGGDGQRHHRPYQQDAHGDQPAALIERAARHRSATDRTAQRGSRSGQHLAPDQRAGGGGGSRSGPGLRSARRPGRSPGRGCFGGSNASLVPSARVITWA